MRTLYAFLLISLVEGVQPSKDLPKVQQLLITLQNATSFGLELQEASMPNDVAGYEFSLLSESGNVTWEYTRVAEDVKGGWLNQTFSNVIVPDTHYVLSVRPYLKEADKTNYGEPVQTEFSTDPLELPKPANLVEKLTFDGESAKIQISWEIGVMPENFRVATVGASVVSSGSFHWSDPLNVHNALSISDLPHSTDFSLTLNPIYTVRFANQDVYFRQRPTLYLFRTPMSGPRILKWSEVDSYSRNNTDFTKVRLDWDAGSCGASYPSYKIEVQRTGSDEKTSYEIQETSLTLENVEFFTDYEVTLEAGVPCPHMTKPQISFRVEGGVPHRVKSAHVEVQPRDITITVEEAFMPKDVHTYSIGLNWTGIWNEPQKTFDIRRDESNAKDGIFKATLRNVIRANAVYDLTVSPQYKDGNETVTGPPYRLQFEGERVEFPDPENVVFHLSALEDNKQDLNMTWELKPGDYNFVEYSVIRLEPFRVKDLIITTKTPSYSQTDVPCRSQYGFFVIPVYNYSGALIKSRGAWLYVGAAECVPIKTYGEQKVFYTEVSVKVGWDIPSQAGVFDFRIEICSAECSNKTVSPLDRSYSLYHECNDHLNVSVSALYGGSKESSKVVLFDEKTRICQPSAPSSLKAEQKQNELHLTWSAPESKGGPHVSYEVSLLAASDGLDNPSVRINTDSLNASLTFPEPPSNHTYRIVLFASTENEDGKTLKSYSVEEHCDYKWPQKPKSVTLVERESVKLCFELDPAEEMLNGVYRISTSPSVGRLIGPVSSKVCVEDLKPFELITLQARACYLGTKDVCSEAFELEEKTRVASPSKVLSLTAEGEPDGSLLISWERPEQPAGPIDGYNLNLTVVQKDRTEQKMLPGSGLSFRIVSPIYDVDYKIIITAFNEDPDEGQFESIPETYGFRFANPNRLGTGTILVIIAACLGLVAALGGGAYWYRKKHGPHVSGNNITLSQLSN